MSDIQKGYEIAREIYVKYGVDIDEAIEKCAQIPISIHCWQIDDVGGFEGKGGALTGGIQTTGNYPGKARNFEEMFSDLEKVLSYIPGVKKIGIHASYLDNKGKFVDRNEIEPEHFDKWIEFANKNGIGLDFNSTYFSHPKSESGYTLSSADEEIRKFWIEHAKRSRKISAYIAEKTGKPVVHNLWIPDGEKEVPIDTFSPRARLKDSLDQIFEEKYENVIDAVESKLFGIGSEAYVVGSHEFYMGYVMSRKDLAITLDSGHFHPTETVSSKLSAVFQFTDKVLLHVSRPVRWDSDHVVNFDDETRNIMSELARMQAYDKTYISTDYFDASVNRVMALGVGVRNTAKAILDSFLLPVEMLKEIEVKGDTSGRLALTQEIRALPIGLIWDAYCEKNGIPTSPEWIEDARKYERDVMLQR